MKIQRLSGALIVLVVLSLLVACGGGTSSGSAGGEQGTLAIQLADAPVDSVSAVNNVRIVGLKITRSGTPVVSLGVPAKTINLLLLENATLLMVEARVPAGRYEFIQNELDESQSTLVENGETESLRIPSEEIKVLGGFEVLPVGTTTVLLDFDAEKSLLPAANGWQLKPVILLANVSMS